MGKTAVQLEQATGYSDKPVRQALRDLEGMGLVEHIGKRRGWRLRRRYVLWVGPILAGLLKTAVVHGRF